MFVPVTAAEIECTVTNLSPAGAGVDITQPPSAGTEIVLYIEGFDRFAGAVAWVSRSGLGVRFPLFGNKRARTAERIYDYLVGEPVLQTAVRRSTRLSPPPVRALHRTNGQSVAFEVMDISLDGAALRTEVPLAVGETVSIGLTQGVVTRVFQGGAAVEFVRRLREAAIRK